MHIKKSVKSVQNLGLMMSINQLCVNLWKADVLKGFCVLSTMVLLWSWAILLAGWGAGLSPLPGFKTWPSNILLAASLSQISEDGEAALRESCSSGWADLGRGRLPARVPGCKSQAFPSRNSYGCGVKCCVLRRGKAACPCLAFTFLLTPSGFPAQLHSATSSVAAESWKSQRHFKEFRWLSLTSTCSSFLITF